MSTYVDPFHTRLKLRGVKESWGVHITAYAEMDVARITEREWEEIRYGLQFGITRSNSSLAYRLFNSALTAHDPNLHMSTLQPFSFGVYLSCSRAAKFREEVKALSTLTPGAFGQIYEYGQGRGVSHVSALFSRRVDSDTKKNRVILNHVREALERICKEHLEYLKPVRQQLMDQLQRDKTLKFTLAQ